MKGHLVGLLAVGTLNDVDLALVRPGLIVCPQSRPGAASLHDHGLVPVFPGAFEGVGR